MGDDRRRKHKRFIKTVLLLFRQNAPRYAFSQTQERNRDSSTAPSGTMKPRERNKIRIICTITHTKYLIHVNDYSFILAIHDFRNNLPTESKLNLPRTIIFAERFVIKHTETFPHRIG